MDLHKLASSSRLRILLLGFVLPLCGCDRKNDEDSNALGTDVQSQEQISRERYRTMFGSIIVPTYRNLGEPEAPGPLIYVVTDEEGEILGLRRPQSDNGPWAFEELPLGAITADRVSVDFASLVIAAHKEIKGDRFIRLAKELANKTGKSKIWVQVWGVHPYPLQIPIDLGDESLMSGLANLENLQQIVDRISGNTVRESAAKDGRNAGNRQAEQGGAGQPATRSESDSKGGDKPQPEVEGRSR